MEYEKSQVEMCEKPDDGSKSIKSSDHSNDQSTVIVPPNRVLLYGTTAFVSLGALLFGMQITLDEIYPSITVTFLIRFPLISFQDMIKVSIFEIHVNKNDATASLTKVSF